MNRTLFYQYFIIGIVNYIDYYHDWNKIYIESSESKNITFFINSFIVAILCLGIIINMYKKEEKNKKEKKKRKRRRQRKIKSKRQKK